LHSSGEEKKTKCLRVWIFDVEGGDRWNVWNVGCLMLGRRKRWVVNEDDGGETRSLRVWKLRVTGKERWNFYAKAGPGGEKENQCVRKGYFKLLGKDWREKYEK
jgi:hypothetical protein